MLLAGNPLQDIGHLRDIQAVVLRGRLLARPELERIIESHRRPAAQ